MPKHGDDFSKMTSTGVSRRTIVKGAAWSVPAVVLATAIPASAAASGNIVPTSVTGIRSGADKSHVAFTVNFTNTSPGVHTVNWSLPPLPAITLLQTGWVPRTGSFDLPDGATSFVFNSQAFGLIELLGVISIGLAQPAPDSTTISFTVVGHPPTVALPAAITG